MGALTEFISGFGDMSLWSRTALIDITLFGTGLGIVTKAVGSGLTTFASFTKNVEKLATTLGTTVGTLSAWTLGIGAVALAIGGAIYWFATADERLLEFNNNIINSINESEQKIAQSQQNVATAQQALAEIQRLEAELNSSNSAEQRAEKEEEILNLKQQMLQQFPELAKGYENEALAIDGMSEALKKYIEQQEISIKKEQQKQANLGREFFSEPENKDIMPSINSAFSAQQNIDTLNKSLEELYKITDEEMMIKVNVNGQEMILPVKEAIQATNDELIRNEDILMDSEEAIDKWCQAYEAIVENGGSVSKGMEEQYNAIKKLKEGQYELAESTEKLKIQFENYDAYYSPDQVRQMTADMKAYREEWQNLSDDAENSLNTIDDMLDSGKIEGEEYAALMASYLDVVGLKYGEMGDAANSGMDTILAAYANGKIGQEDFTAAMDVMGLFATETFSGLAQSSQEAMTTMLEGMISGSLGVGEFQLGVDGYLSLVGDSFANLSEAEQTAIETMIRDFANGSLSSSDFQLALSAMGFLASEEFYKLDTNSQNALRNLVTSFNNGEIEAGTFAQQVATYMGLSEQSINQLAQMSAQDIQTLMNSFLSGELSAEQLQQAIDLMHNNPNLPADVAADMITVRTAMQETEKKRDDLQNKIDTMKGNDKWSNQFSNEIKTVTDDLDSGEISGEEFQKRIDALKSNPSFKQYFTQELEEVLEDLKNNKQSGDDLQERINTLKDNPAWASLMSGQFDTVKTSASNAKGEVQNLGREIGGLQSKTVTLTTNKVTNYSSSGAVPLSGDNIPNNQPVYSAPDDNPVPTEPTPSGDANVPMVAKTRETVQEDTGNNYGIATAASSLKAFGLSFDTSKNYDNLSEEEKKLQQERERLESAANSAIEKLRNKLYTALKKKIEKQKQDELSIYDARIEAIKKEMALLDESVSTSTEDTLAGERSKLEKLHAELDKWEQNNSAFAISKIAELKEAILDQEEAVRKAEVELKKEQLQAQIDLIEEEQDAVSEKYDQMLTDEYLYGEANKLLLSQNMDEMLNLIKEFAPDFSDIGMLLGQSLTDGILESITQGLDGFNYITNPNNSINNSTSSGSSSGSSSGNSTDLGTVVDEIVNEIVVEETPKSSKGRVTATNLNVRENAGTNNKVIGSVYKNEEVDILDEKDGWYNIQYWSDVYKKNRKGWVSGQYLQRFNTGGLVGSWNDGQPRMAMVDTKERVLSAEQTKSFDDLVYKFLPQFASMIRSLRSVGTPDNANNNVTFNNNYEVTNKTEFDVKNNMETIEYRQKQQLRRAGVL